MTMSVCLKDSYFQIKYPGLALQKIKLMWKEISRVTNNVNKREFLNKSKGESVMHLYFKI